MLQTSGTIYLSQIQSEFGGPNYYLGTYYRGGGYTTANNTNVPTSGQISFAQFYGAIKVVPGSRSYGPGTYYLAIPPYAWITFDVRASGGGGGACGVGFSGSAGGTSQVYGGNVSVYANGGAGGAYAVVNGSNYPNGLPRAADGWGNQGAGGGAGGTGGTQSSEYGTAHGQNGGYGGRSVITYSAGQLVTGATMTIIVAGGGAGAGSNGVSTPGAAGAGGAVYISWG